MHFLVAAMAEHDAVAYRLPKFGKSCQRQNVVQFQLLIFKRLSAVRALATLTLIQLVFVLDAVVLRVVRVHQVADRSLLHPAIRDVEIQSP